MLTQFVDRFPLVLRLVAITLLIPSDTSECERIFSLMNDIKTAERSSIGQRNLKNLMLWFVSARNIEADGSLGGKKMACRDVPVMEIVKEFREINQRRNGNHKPEEVPKYEYEKHRAPVKIE